MTLMLSWRQPRPAVVTRWRGSGQGPDGRSTPSALSPLTPMPLAAIIGPPGAPGSPGSPGLSPLIGELTLTLPGGEGVWEYSAVSAAADVKPGMTVFAALKPVPDTYENDPELADIGSIAALAEAGAIRVSLACTAPMSGPIFLQWSAF